jgi:hypothetical protein
MEYYAVKLNGNKIVDFVARHSDAAKIAYALQKQFGTVYVLNEAGQRFAVICKGDMERPEMYEVMPEAIKLGNTVRVISTKGEDSEVIE